MKPTLNENCSETYALLRISGRAIDPADVTKKVGLVPTFSVCVGESRPAGTRPRDEAIWAYSTQGAVGSSDLADHVQLLMKCLAPDFRNLLPDDCRVDIQCIWRSATGHGGPTLPAALLVAVGGRGIDLDFDIYFDE